MMKTKHLLMMLCGSLVLASCSKNSEDQQTNSQPGGFTILASQSAQSRTILDGKQILWAEGDQLSVTTYPVAGAQSEVFDLTAGANTRQGTFTGPSLAAGNYMAFYPYQSAPPVTVGNAFDLTLQSQYEDGSDHLGKYDFLYSHPVQVQAGAVSAEFSFMHALSLQELRIYLDSRSPLTDAIINKVTFVAHKADGTPVSVFGTSVYYDMSQNAMVAANKSSQMSIRVNTATPLKSANYFPVYMVMDHEQASGMYPYVIDLQIDLSSASSGAFTFVQEGIKTVNGAGGEYMAGTKYTNQNTPINVYQKYFPDANFRAVLKGLGLVEVNGDIDPVSNAAKIATILSLDLSGKNITSLKGIEYLTALTSLNCSVNQLATLDVSHNKLLTSLSCQGNNLTTLDVSKNTALVSLSCQNNKLATLNVSGNLLLTSLQCNDNNMTQLDIHTSPLLLLNVTNLVHCGQQKAGQLQLTVSLAQSLIWELLKNLAVNANVVVKIQ